MLRAVSCGVLQVDSWEYGEDRLLFLSQFVGKDARDNKGYVKIYRFRDDEGIFVMEQSIPTRGATDVEPFVIPGEGGGEFLAIANRQSGEDSSERNLTIYDQDSVIYRYAVFPLAHM